MSPISKAKRHTLAKMAGRRHVSVLEGAEPVGIAGKGLSQTVATKALRAALLQVALPYTGLSLRIVNTQEQDAVFTTFSADLPKTALFVLFEGVGGTALMALDASLVDALIEVQTIRKLLVTPRAAASRSPTRIDAALTRDFCENLIEFFARHMGTARDARLARGLHYSTFYMEPEPLSLLVGDAPLKAMRVDVSLGEADRQAVLWLALPLSGADDNPKPNSDKPARKTPVDTKWAETLRATLEDAPLRLDAYVARPKLPLQKINTLQVGDLIALPSGAIEEVQMTTWEKVKGVKGKLGQQNGMRAIRLNFEGKQPVQSEFTQSFAGQGAQPSEATAEETSDSAPIMPPLPELPSIDLPASSDAPLSELPSLPELPNLGD